MVEVTNIEVVGLERSIKASGNAMLVGEINTLLYKIEIKEEREKNINRCTKLGTVPTGTGHDNFLKGIDVYFDIKYPQYFTPELQRYHWIDIITSQSKMHRLTTAPKNMDFKTMFNQYVDWDLIERVQEYCSNYNDKEKENEKYYWFMKALSNLPMGYELWMTVKTNYLQLKTIYFQRKDHKLKEDWKEFCNFILSLPMFKELVLKGKEK